MGIGNADVVSVYDGDTINSLPLMGIGDPERVVRAGQNGRLITPHGDWELDRVLDQLGQFLGLITPHGDWERSSGLHSVRHESTHYPSWGLGTGLDPQ